MRSSMTLRTLATCLSLWIALSPAARALGTPGTGAVPSVGLGKPAVATGWSVEWPSLNEVPRLAGPVQGAQLMGVDRVDQFIDGTPADGLEDDLEVGLPEVDPVDGWLDLDPADRQAEIDRLLAIDDDATDADPDDESDDEEGTPASDVDPADVDEVGGARDDDGKLLGPDGKPLDDDAVRGLIATRDAAVDELEAEIDRLESLLEGPRSQKVELARMLILRLRQARNATESSLLREALEQLWGMEPPAELLEQHPELAIEDIGLLNDTALWEALLDEDLFLQLTVNPDGLARVEQDQLLVDLLNSYLQMGIGDLAEKAAAFADIDRLQDLWQFGAAEFESARDLLAATDPAAAALAALAYAAYAEKQPATDYNLALDRHLRREAGRVTGERDGAGRLLDGNGNTVSLTTVMALLLVRDLVASQVLAFASHLDALYEGPRSDKLEFGHALRDKAREIRDAYVNLVSYEALATNPYDQSGRVRGYPKDEYDRILRRADQAERAGDSDEADRLRAEAASSLYGTYRARALAFYRLLDEAPELAIEVDGVKLWEALLDDDFYEEITGRTGLSSRERDQAFVDLINVYLVAGARQAREEAAETKDVTQIDELIEFGSPRFTRAQSAAAQLGAAVGATLPADLVAEAEAFYDGFRLTEQADEALVRGVTDLTLTVIAAGSTLLVPVLAPAAWGAVAAVQITWDGTEVVVAYLEESEISDEALATGHVHILSAQERRRAAEQQFIFTALASVPDLVAAVHVRGVRVEAPKVSDAAGASAGGAGAVDSGATSIAGRHDGITTIDAPPAGQTGAAAADDVAGASQSGTWLTPDGKPATVGDLQTAGRQISFDDLQEAAAEARLAGVPEGQIDDLVGGLGPGSSEFDTQFAQLQLEDLTLRALGFEILEGVPDEFEELVAIYVRGRDRGGLAPDDYEVLRGWVQQDPNYLDMLDRRAAVKEAGEHEILFNSEQADQLRQWFADGPLPPEGTAPVPAGGAPGGDVPPPTAPDHTGPGQTQAVSEHEILGSAPGDETVRLPAFEPPPAAAAEIRDASGTYRELSSADEYAELVVRQENGEILDFTEVARPGIAGVTPDGEILIFQGAGRWERARPGEYIDVFIDSRASLPPESGAVVVETGISPELVRDANLLSSRGVTGANPTIVNGAIGEAESFQRVRIPVENVDAPTSFVPPRVDDILETLRGQGVDTSALEEVLAPLSPSERLQLLEDDAARAAALGSGSSDVPDETLRLPAPDLPPLGANPAAVDPSAAGSAAEAAPDLVRRLDPATEPLAIGGPSGPAGPLSPLEVVVISRGGSTGPVMDMYIVNHGKPLQFDGDGVVLEPIEDPDAETMAQVRRIRAATAGVGSPAGTANPVSSAGIMRIPLDGYCLQFDRGVPTEGTLYRIADRRTQESYEPMRRILAASRELFDNDLLVADPGNPDYFHSLRQWAIWVDEKHLDRVAYEEAFVAHAQANFEAAGAQWSDDVEALVRDLVPQRWGDISAVLERAGLSVPSVVAVSESTPGSGSVSALFEGIGHRPLQPRPRRGPQPVDGARRHVERARRLLYGQATEVAKLDHIGHGRVVRFEAIEGRIQSQQLFGSRGLPQAVLVHRRPPQVAAVLLA